MLEQKSTSEQNPVQESPFAHSMSKTLRTFLDNRFEHGLSTIDPAACLEYAMTMQEVVRYLENQFPNDIDNQLILFAITKIIEQPNNHPQELQERLTLSSSFRFRIAQLQADADFYNLHGMMIPSSIHHNISSYQSAVDMLTAMKSQNTISVLTTENDWLPMPKDEYDQWIADGGLPPVTVAE